MTLLSPWVTADDIIGPDPYCPSCAGVESITPETADLACGLASAVLYQLSGRRFPGVAERTVRPASRRRTDRLPPDGRVTSDVLVSGPASLYGHVPPGWHEAWGWHYEDDPNDIAGRRQITLGFYPIVSITEVSFAGVTFDPANYRVDEGKWLVRTDGGLWPCRQDWWRNDDEPGTWKVVFDYGVAPSEDAKTVAAVYACELAKSFCGMECALPARTTSITRQGVTQVVFDPLDLVADGMVGLPLVDTWIKAVNPHRRRSRARILSPDVPRRVRRG